MFKSNQVDNIKPQLVIRTCGFNQSYFRNSFIHHLLLDVAKCFGINLELQEVPPRIMQGYHHWFTVPSAQDWITAKKNPPRCVPKRSWLHFLWKILSYQIPPRSFYYALLDHLRPKSVPEKFHRPRTHGVATNTHSIVEAGQMLRQGQAIDAFPELWGLFGQFQDCQIAICAARLPPWFQKSQLVMVHAVIDQPSTNRWWTIKETVNESLANHLSINQLVMRTFRTVSTGGKSGAQNGNLVAQQSQSSVFACRNGTPKSNG